MPSLAAQFWIAVLKVTGRKKTFLSAEALHGMMAQRANSITYDPPEYVEKRCHVDEALVGGYPVITLTPKTGTSGDAFMYLHGGAYVFEIIERQWMFAADMACRLGRTVYVPIYPLAPTSTAADTLAFAEKAYLWAEEKVGYRRLDVFGDSAGAGMAVAIMQVLQAKGITPKAKSLALLSPWFDITLETDGVLEVDRVDPWISKPGLVEAGKLYAGDLQFHDPRVSPIEGPLNNLPPCHIFIGTRDIMLADCRRFEEKMKAEGGEVYLTEYKGMFHCWPVVKSPEGKKLREQLADVLTA
ncbi:alpha/beta hydrolase fold domain-containing protein [Kordiimonas sp. SCSIO 12603]|uniref:alpha/beta hydrolase fold domain-containing protein n=1 Tax=Kordiimonas sp. SCSIO 12603 TaxID=2829596 RepID=UPI0021048CAA|nr:alpha/beta hydrolase fold domain-containing protein [Kordiimonas sp. SCSIO 12603]UTW60030.1 alpha/beta hydrolase fold domain-containing protein [Kordiimonas sp. SCSIO 12603]